LRYGTEAQCAAALEQAEGASVSGLRVWFLAIYLISQTKTGLSALVDLSPFDGRPFAWQ
jgi:hypothetical protein